MALVIADLVDRVGHGLAARWVRRTHALVPARSALLLVDVQLDLFDPGGGTGLIAPVVAGTDYWERLLALTRASRAAGLTVVHAPLWSPAEAGVEALAQTGYFVALRQAGALRPNAPGSEIPRELFAPTDVCLPPRTTMNAFYGTPLPERLAEGGITHLIVAGSTANASVDSTARMGVELDYWVTVASDCVGALTPAERRLTLEVTLPRLVHRVERSASITRRFDPTATDPRRAELRGA